MPICQMQRRPRYRIPYACRDRLHDRIGLLKHLRVIKPHKCVAQGTECRRPFAVLGFSPWRKMLRSIQLYPQFDTRSGKVKDVGTYRPLTIERHTMDLPATQPVPQPLLRIGSIGAQFARPVPQQGRSHARFKSPRSLRSRSPLIKGTYSPPCPKGAAALCAAGGLDRVTASCAMGGLAQSNARSPVA